MSKKSKYMNELPPNGIKIRDITDTPKGKKLIKAYIKKYTKEQVSKNTDRDVDIKTLAEFAEAMKGINATKEHNSKRN